MAAIQLAPGIFRNAFLINESGVKNLIEAQKRGEDLQEKFYDQVTSLEEEAIAAAMRSPDKSLGQVKNPRPIGFVLPKRLDRSVIPVLLEGFGEGLTRDTVSTVLKDGGRVSPAFEQILKDRRIPLENIDLHRPSVALQEEFPHVSVPLALLDPEKNRVLHHEMFQFLSVERMDDIKHDLNAVKFTGKLIRTILIHLADLSQDKELKTNPVKLKEALLRRLQLEDFQDLVRITQKGPNASWGINAVAAKAVFEALTQRSLQSAA